MSEKEVIKQNKKGIFTVTQLSYTFRPRRKGKRVKDKTPNHYYPLKALAIRENKIFIFETPELVNLPAASRGASLAQLDFKLRRLLPEASAYGG